MFVKVILKTCGNLKGLNRNKIKSDQILGYFSGSVFCKMSLPGTEHTENGDGLAGKTPCLKI